ncbi:TetR/AcrR family transcriptional regulator [Paenibacillus puerhi]|uniref:TetR/AcrR family transcriptional regulator n=1 Tax=Paenibacillus puerhi TaxID=2692622 RepID=UPI00135B700E|nr:TetR-like C-terminal domain-containing protein [Paenibacillus puerhi]
MSPRIGLDLPAILQAATEIADREGYKEVSLASLAQKLKVRSPSLYNHVHGLTGLRREMTLHGIELLTADLTHAAVGRSGEEAIRAMSLAYVTFARRHPGLYEATLQAPAEDDTEHRQASERILALLLRVLEAYQLREDKALHAIRCFRSLLHGFASLEQQGGFGLPLDLDDTLQHLIDTFLAGVSKLQAEQRQSSGKDGGA